MNTGFDQYHTTRRRSFSGGFPAGGGGGFVPPHSDGGFRRDGFNNDPYNTSSSYQEVSGPPSYPPPGGISQGRPPPSNMPIPNDLPPLASQPFQSGGPGSFPSSAGLPGSYSMGGARDGSYSMGGAARDGSYSMGGGAARDGSYSMGGTREPYSSSPYDTGMNSTNLPPPGSHAAYSNSYDNSPLSDNQYPLDDGFNPRGRTLSTGGGFGSQALVPAGFAPPMTPHPSQYSAKRSRRASSVGPGGGMGYVGIVGDPYRRHPSGHNTSIKFRLKGSQQPGISVNEALERVRLSQGNGYLMHDVSMDRSGKISLKIRWSGYRSNIYSIPLSTDYNGYVEMQSLARRTARAIVHFMDTNGISLSWNRVVMHRLEENSPGVWIPVLMTH